MIPSTLRFEALRRDFGRLRVLDDVSGAATAGELLLVTGSNGSGKSTLLRCLAGLLALDAGEIALTHGGEELDMGERRRLVGYVAPDLAFYEELTALENLTLFARFRRVPASRGEALADRLKLPTDRPTGALSSGQMQRLRWCFALLPDPPVLLLDEPFQNFDRRGAETAREMLDEQLARGALAVAANPAELELPRVARRLDLDR